MNNEIKFAIHTLGCKVNQYESDKIIGQFKKAGWVPVDFPSPEADVHIINTCTVTAVANHKSRQLIRRAINGNPKSIIAVTGCYADSDKDEIMAIEGVSLVVGNSEKTAFPVIVADRLGVELQSHPFTDMGVSVDLNASAGIDISTGISSGATLHTRSLVKVQDGCNNFCTYCIVPHVRGDLWSRPVVEVVDEVSRLVSAGTKEIVLTGIHLGLYGVTALDGRDTVRTQQASENGEAVHSIARSSLGDLIKRLIQIRDLGRIRLSSIELNEVTPEIAGLIAASDKLCNHLHIPLQSGSDDVLRRMNRHYTAEEFIERTDALRQAVDNLAITTDVIVGFPGETERDFERTVQTIARVGFSKLHVFKYSLRKGTPAATFENQIPNKIKDERSRTLIERGSRLSAEFAARYLEKDLTVLLEREIMREEGEYLTGMSDNYIRVLCKGPSSLIGKLVTVSISDREEEKLIGSVFE